MPAGARFRNGIGFLNSGEVSKFTEDLDEEGDETPTLEVGGIIGIVVAFLVLLRAGHRAWLCSFACVVHAAVSQSMSVSNAGLLDHGAGRSRPLQVPAVRQGVQLRERSQDSHQHSSHVRREASELSPLFSFFHTAHAIPVSRTTLTFSRTFL
jgi:hypothetical protein